MNFSYEIIPFQERIKQIPVLNKVAQPKIAQQQFPLIQEEESSKSRLRLRRHEKPIWTEAESKRYVKFLMKQHKIFELSTEQKRRLKVNVKMSKAVKTRTATQCHSHHQKMLKKYGSLLGIIDSLKELVGPKEFSAKNKQEKELIPIENADQQQDQNPQNVDICLQLGLGENNGNNFLNLFDLMSQFELQQ